MINKEIITLRGRNALVEFDYQELVPGSKWNPPEGGYEICEISWDEDGRLLAPEELEIFEEEILCQLEELRKERYHDF